MAKKKFKNKKNIEINSSTKSYENAVKYFNKGNFRKTALYCQKAADQNDINIDKKLAASINFTRVLALMKLNDLESAKDIINKAEQQFGTYLDLMFMKIMLAKSANDTEIILKCVDEYDNLYKQTDPKANNYLKQSYNSIADVLWTGAEAALKLSDYNRASDYMERSLILNPDKHQNRIHFADFLVEQHKTEKAITLIEEGIREFPDFIAYKNYKGLILARLEKFKEAEDHFKGLLETYPNDADAVNNLGVVYDKQGKYDLAKKYFEKALNLNSGNQQARENLDYINKLITEKPQTISACMIVKNEEKFLPGCLESIKGLVDEIIIVDTGSTDRTMEIAREYGAKIYEHPWENDFSLHRNQSMGYATSDWILIIDADEEFDPAEHENIKMLIKRKDIEGVSFVVYNEINYDRVGCLTSKRIFRNHKGYKYDGIVHNQLRMSGKTMETDFKVIHHGYALSEEDMRKKAKRSEELLLKQVEEKPDYIFAHFNLAQLYRGEENFERCLKHSKILVDNSSFEETGNRHLYLMGLDQLGCAYFGVGQHEKAIETLKKALKYKNDYLDPIFNLGIVYFNLEKYDEAEEYFRKYLEVSETYAPEKDSIQLMLNNLSSEHITYYMLGFMDFIKENYEAAIENFNKALDYVDDIKDIHNLLVRCYRTKGDFSRVIDHCDKAVKHGYERAEIRLLEGEAYMNKGDVQTALNCFNRALELKPDLQEAKIAIINASSISKNPTEILESIDEYLEKSPISPKVLASKGDLLFNLGRYNIARQSYIQSKNQNPDDYRVLNNLGNCFLKEKNYASAEECYQSALQKNKDFARAYRNLGIALINQNKTAEAIEYLEHYLSIQPEDAEVHATIGDLYYNDKKYIPAISHYEHYLKKYPDNVDALIRFSDCYMNLGKLQAAALGFRAVLARDTSNKIARQRLEELNEFLQPIASP